MDKVDQLVQVENHVDFIALKRQGVDIGSYLLYQGIYDYFGILNGPSYAELVKDIQVKAYVYDREAAKHEKIVEDESLTGKTRAEMGLQEFTGTEIRSAVAVTPRFPKIATEKINQSNIIKRSITVIP